MVGGVRRAQVFSNSWSTAGGTAQEGDGNIWPDDLAISFPIAASTWYAVNLGAYVECDHSAGIGLSRAQAAVNGLVKWVVVKRWT
jgi:hypothetical protein